MRARQFLLLIALTAMAFCGRAWSQVPGPIPPSPDRELRYEAIHTGASGGETVTVQQPATPTAAVQFEYATVYCAAACTVQIVQNSTGATATTLAPTALNGAPPSQVTAFSASNISGGTTLNTYHVATTTTLVLDLSKFYLGKGAGINANLSLVIAGSGSTPQTMIQWTER